MTVDERIRAAFESEARGVEDGGPTGAETSRALAAARSAPAAARRRLGSGDLLPVLAMAAAAIAAAWIDPGAARGLRPLAGELAAAMPDGAGERFVDFVLEAGESYRSAD